MRISDWSSDVCSSDLHHRTAQSEHGDPVRIDAGRAAGPGAGRGGGMDGAFARLPRGAAGAGRLAAPARQPDPLMAGAGGRSEEHTSELQSLMRISYAVFCLKKKNST